MADIKVLKINVDGLYEEHNDGLDSIKVASLKTATHELTDTKLGQLISGGDASAQHDHSSLYIPLTEKAFPNGIATLDANGKLSNAQVPAIAITTTFVVADQVAQDAIVGAEEGDVAVRQDLMKSFIKLANGSWTELLSPTDQVQTVNGMQGTVVLGASDLKMLDGTTTIQSKLDSLQSEIDAEEALALLIRQTPKQQIICVAKNGNDSTGTGSDSSPFLTIAAANAAITDAYFVSFADFKRYVVSIGPGVYLEAPGLELKTHVTYVSTGSRGATSISVSSGNIVWNVPDVGTPKVNLYNITIASPIVITSGSTVNTPFLEAYHFFATSGITWNNAVGLNEKQLIAFSGIKASGVYRLNLGGQASADINFNDSAATIQAKIEAMSGIGAGNILVAAVGENFEVEFVGALAKINVFPFTVTNNTLQDSGLSAITIAVTESVATMRQAQYQIRYSRLANISTTGNVFGLIEHSTHGTIIHGSTTATSTQGFLQRIGSTSGFSTVNVNAASYIAINAYAENTVINDRGVLGAKTLSYTSDSVKQASLVLTSTTHNHNRLSDVRNINYSPAVIGDWNTPPTEGKSALDELASRTKATELASALYIPLTQKASPNGVATLDSNGLVLSSQLPSYVDDVIEVADMAALNALALKEQGKIYVTVNDNKTYRWSGTTFIYITSGAVDTVNGQTGIVVLTTDNIAEGASNFYYTQAKFSADFATKSTDGLVEGISNLYFTNVRAKAAAVSDVIVDGITDMAPSQNAVFDALALKANQADLDQAIIDLGNAISSSDSYPSYIAAEAISKGDVVYISSNGSVSKYSTLSNNDELAGVAMETVASAALVKVALSDAIVTGVISSAIAGARYYWGGSALSTSMSTATGANVYLIGVATNATDLLVKVRHIRKNA